MKKSSSNPKYTNRAHLHTASEGRRTGTAKNKTNSTVVNTEAEPQQHTTKKNSMQKVNSCVKIANSNKSSKSDLLKI